MVVVAVSVWVIGLGGLRRGLFRLVLLPCFVAALRRNPFALVPAGGSVCGIASMAIVSRHRFTALATAVVWLIVMACPTAIVAWLAAGRAWVGGVVVVTAGAPTLV
ncbi:hypothetical protein ACQI5H_24505 [Mycobacterium heidelbergense]|uniref:hypothetical protein n=1 Tax=Mycobacterium heidelbergense TaxID=53376 RepID=UPI003CEB49AE